MLTAGPSRLTSSVLLVASAGLALLGAASDPTGRVLAWPAAVALAAVGLRDLCFGPVLTADSQGLTLVSGVSRRALAWSEVIGVRVVNDRRTPLLELDLGHTLQVLSRRRLGRPPSEVLLELISLRPPRTPVS